MKTQVMKMNPIYKMTKNSLMDLPTPSSISFLWNMGFLLGMTLMFQIVSGLIVSMAYTPNISTAFASIVAISRDIDMGWVTRNLHMNGASLFFMLMYLHMARGIYFTSPKNQKKVWFSGMVIMLMTMGTAFLGYVLPWGQMSFWGATVITGVLSAIPLIGSELVTWIWGGASVSQPTLNRFFSLHFMMPMIILALVLVHLIFLHEKGSSNPTNSNTSLDKMKFYPSFLIKDLTPMIILSCSMLLVVSNSPNLLNDVENFCPANPMVAPAHIQPEWYFLFAYVILRSVPSKLGGVIALGASVLILFLMMLNKSESSKFNTTKKMKFWLFVSTLMILTWIGAKSVETPFEQIGQIYTIIYFTMIFVM